MSPVALGLLSATAVLPGPLALLAFRIRHRAYLRKLRRDAQVIAALYLADKPLTGLDLGKVTGLGPGRVHVHLARLEASGIVESEWAPGGWPRRRYYRLVGGAS